MKRILLLIAIFHLPSSIFNFTHAQWIQLISGTTESLEEIFFPAADTGYAIGWNGTVLKTVDGTSWTSSSIAAGENLYDVFFLDTQKGFVVGDSGLFAKTTDGGGNWSHQYIPNVLRLSSIYFTDANTGFAGGTEDFSIGVIYKTIDGGLNWTLTNTPSSFLSLNYNRIVFPSADTGYALTRGYCMKTIDAGNNWFYTDTFLFDNGLMFSVLEDACFFSPDTGYIVGWYNPFTGYTSNAGITWSDDSLGQWYAVEFPSRQTGFMMGWGQLIKTIDGGSTWIDISSALIQNNGLYSLDFTDDNTGYACGNNGTIIKTASGGTTAVNELSQQNIFNCYPNPAGAEIFLSSAEQINEIIITDVSGKIIFQAIPLLLLREIKIQTSNFSNGIYFIKIYSDKGISAKKFIIQK